MSRDLREFSSPLNLHIHATNASMALIVWAISRLSSLPVRGWSIDTVIEGLFIAAPLFLIFEFVVPSIVKRYFQNTRLTVNQSSIVRSIGLIEQRVSIGDVSRVYWCYSRSGVLKGIDIIHRGRNFRIAGFAQMDEIAEVIRTALEPRRIFHAKRNFGVSVMYTTLKLLLLPVVLIIFLICYQVDLTQLILIAAMGDVTLAGALLSIRPLRDKMTEVVPLGDRMLLWFAIIGLLCSAGLLCAINLLKL